MKLLILFGVLVIVGTSLLSLSVSESNRFRVGTLEREVNDIDRRLGAVERLTP